MLDRLTLTYNRSPLFSTPNFFEVLANPLLQTFFLFDDFNIMVHYKRLIFVGYVVICYRTRQASITTELIEIISGASALEG